jgi:sRNA-binding carbon storage regulator CsrA
MSIICNSIREEMELERIQRAKDAIKDIQAGPIFVKGLENCPRDTAYMYCGGNSVKVIGIETPEEYEAHRKTHAEEIAEVEAAQEQLAKEYRENLSDYVNRSTLGDFVPSEDEDDGPYKIHSPQTTAGQIECLVSMLDMLLAPVEKRAFRKGLLTGLLLALGTAIVTALIAVG